MISDVIDNGLRAFISERRSTIQPALIVVPEENHDRVRMLSRESLWSWVIRKRMEKKDDGTAANACGHHAAELMLVDWRLRSQHRELMSSNNGYKGPTHMATYLRV